jgi:exoribonuclease R
MDLSCLQNKLMVGLLSTSQQVKYGKTSNGKPIFQINPLDHKLPNFWITYGGSLKGKIIIIFKFKEYKEGTLPFGEIYDIIGLASEENLTKALIFHYGINRKNFKLIDYKLNENEKNINRKNLSHLNIFSIDPKGCIDIDDALSIENIEDGYSIGVHIAQPICWLTKEDILSRSTAAFSTLYSEKHQELWSEEVVSKASLKSGEIKPAYSIIFTVKDNKIIKTESFPSIIINKLNTSYEEIDYPQIKELMTVTENIIGKKLDSHELVSEWMVLANNYIGKTFEYIPFRTQKQSENKLTTEINEIFKNLDMESAEYSFDEEYHHSLGLNKYTHFTSPIRRVIDTIIHYSITYNEKIEIDIKKLNYLDKQTKKFHRQIKLNDLIKTIKDGEMDGWIYKKESNKWMIYFKELGLMKVRVVDDKLAYLLTEEKINQYNIGSNYKFKIHKKPGFMPKEKILIFPSFNLID